MLARISQNPFGGTQQCINKFGSNRQQYMECRDEWKRTHVADDSLKIENNTVWTKEKNSIVFWFFVDYVPTLRSGLCHRKSVCRLSVA